jgi:hypothetical protein
LDWLLERLQNAERSLKTIQSEADVRMTVNCVWWSASGHGGPTLWPKQMSRLSDLNVECSFDVGFYGDDES